jgi:hypothetical protein
MFCRTIVAVTRYKMSSHLYNQVLLPKERNFFFQTPKAISTAFLQPSCLGAKQLSRVVVGSLMVERNLDIAG